MILGPLADILPREAGVVFAGVAALFGAAACGDATRACRPWLFGLGWVVAALGVLAVQAGLASLKAYSVWSAPVVDLDPISPAELVLMLQADGPWLAGAAVIAVVMPVVLWRRRARVRDMSALQVFMEGRRGRGD